MGTSYRGALFGVAAITAAALAAPAFAGCGNAAVQPSAYHVGSSDGARMQLADFGVGAGIVGLWSISLVDGATGQLDDWGYSAWHSDGTEIMNSGGHTPASGNFCLGVWRQTGPNHYHLKHFPLAYDPATGNLAAKIILTEDVTIIDRGGDTFSGPFTEDVYDPTGKTLLQHLAGTITGHRVQPY